MNAIAPALEAIARPVPPQALAFGWSPIGVLLALVAAAFVAGSIARLIAATGPGHRLDGTRPLDLAAHPA